jgi:hypothetical protein
MQRSTLCSRGWKPTSLPPHSPAAAPKGALDEGEIDAGQLVGPPGARRAQNPLGMDSAVLARHNRQSGGRGLESRHCRP